MTVQELINGSLRLIGVIASGETPSTEESNDAFAAANHLLASWSAQQVPVLGITRSTVSMTGASSYTLATRPLRIKAASFSSGGVNTGYDIVSAEVWADAGRNRVLFHDGGYPNATIRLRPAPASGSLELDTLQPLTALASLSTEIAFPPGYERALRFALAMDLAGEYGRPVPAEVAAAASEAIQAIASLNRQVLGEQAPAAPVPVAA